MTDFAKLRNALIGILFLALGGCSEQGPDRALWNATKDAAGAVGDVFKSDPTPEAIDAPDPGDTPYPNLGAMPRRPARPDAATLAAEQAALVAQREAAQRFDAQVRAIDPEQNPSQRPPEQVAAAVVVPTPTIQAAPIVSTPAAPLVASAPTTQTLPAFVPPVLAPTAVPAARPAQVAAPAPARAAANTAWLIGEIGFVEGSPLLTADARRVLRQAVATANERGGVVRVTPLAQGGAAPQDQVLAPRRMAAAAGELESLGLDRSKVLVEAGVYRVARVTVEF